MNLHSSVIKRKAVIDDEDDYLNDYGKVKIIEENKEDVNDKKKKYGKANQRRLYNNDGNDDTDETSNYRF